MSDSFACDHLASSTDGSALRRRHGLEAEHDIQMGTRAQDEDEDINLPAFVLYRNG